MICRCPGLEECAGACRPVGSPGVQDDAHRDQDAGRDRDQAEPARFDLGCTYNVGLEVTAITDGRAGAAQTFSYALRV